MRTTSRAAIAGVLAIAALVSGCSTPERVTRGQSADIHALHPNETPELRSLISKYSEVYGVPEPLIHRVVKRESTYNPGARNGPYYGLMQILPQTARTMGYRGAPSGLLDAETNLRYAVKYLRGAWMVSGGDQDEAVGWYSRGYYYEAKRMGLLEATGLR
ncbi:lytic transglycosylase domain-containing protein [Roseicyclus sp. F158]|uniref:Lytic transglycosylase domain-containing protein n=1 Tax=Tropicimonas omnivorans TaxID=3075590 RepID=A0ABU3DIF9_9RHOB|nr:lytic transglycosylase domain-containing protein [Roseicyclus sp. F158]MDT0683499.1 lytic transglycosylase domain-containing protein [Roseicyclus sp. F158]